MLSKKRRPKTHSANRRPTRRTKRRPKHKETTPSAVSAPARSWCIVDRLQLAELFGVHPDTISDYTRQGMPVVDRGTAGSASSYDAVGCLAWWRDRHAKVNAKDQAQTRQFNAQAELNEVRLARERGELVPRDQVIQEGREYVKAWQAKVRALARQLVLLGVISRDKEPEVLKVSLEMLREISNWKTIADVVKAANEANAA